MTTTIVLVAGLALMMLGTAWLIVLGLHDSSPAVPAATSAPVGEPDPTLPRLQLVFDNMLGTGSSEFSAIALNEDLHRMVIADDDGTLFEFELDADHTPIVPPRREVAVEVGTGDVEGIAWMFGSTYVIADEGDGTLRVVDLADAVDRIGDDDVSRSVETGVEEVDGTGLEGVAYVGHLEGGIEFLIIDERPPTILEVNIEGVVERREPAEIGVRDLSDIANRPDGFSLLSDESRVVVDLARDANGALVELRRLELVTDLGRFEQPEGLVWSRDGTRLYIVGEKPGAERFTFAYYLQLPSPG